MDDIARASETQDRKQAREPLAAAGHAADAFRRYGLSAEAVAQSFRAFAKCGASTEQMLRALRTPAP